MAKKDPSATNPAKSEINPEMFGTQGPEPANGEKRIVVCTHGWVLVGKYRGPTKDHPYVRLDNAYVIRNWGTDKGLGQLAITGPTSETVLDPCQFAEIPAFVSVVFTLLVTCPTWQD